MICKLGCDGAMLYLCIMYFDDKVMGLIYIIKGFEIVVSNVVFSGEFNDVLLVLNFSLLVYFDCDVELLVCEMILVYEKWLLNFVDCIVEFKKVY